MTDSDSFTLPGSEYAQEQAYQDNRFIGTLPGPTPLTTTTGGWPAPPSYPPPAYDTAQSEWCWTNRHVFECRHAGTCRCGEASRTPPAALDMEPGL